ncbi:MAG: hypothetical protein PVJ62_01815 [Deltaproteobacteria bacterium]
MKSSKKKIGDILIEQGLVKTDQIEAAYVVQGTNKKKLGQILIEMGYATEDHIAEAVSKQFSLPVVDRAKVDVNKELLPMVPRQLAEKRMMFPLEMTQQRLLLAMADSLDFEAFLY